MIDINYKLIALRHKPNGTIVFPFITSDNISTIKNEFKICFEKAAMPKEVLDNKFDYDIVLIGTFLSSDGNFKKNSFLKNKLISLISFEKLVFDKKKYDERYSNTKLFSLKGVNDEKSYQNKC